MITYHFPPAMEVGAQACAQIGRYLPAYGWDAVVLTVRERYIENPDGQTQQVFPGAVIRTRVIPHPLFLYRRLKSVLTPRLQWGVGTMVGDTDSLQKMGLLRRWLLSILCLPDSYTGWILPALISGLGTVHRQGVQCLFSSGPWWTNHLVGLALAQLTGLPWVAHFRDPWTQGQRLKPASPLSVRIEMALERMVVRHARALVCVTEPHTELFRKSYPEVHSGKYVTIPNGYDGAEWDGLTLESTGNRLCRRRNTFVITYAGNLYHRRSPYPLFRALRSLIGSGDIVREQIRVDLVGHCEGAEGALVRDVAATYGLADCVTITGPLSRAETLRRVAQSDLLLLLAEDQAYQIPGKTYEYLKAGRPILALTEEGAVADLLRKTGGAWTVHPGDEGGITAAVREAYRCWKDGVEGPRPDPDVVAAFDRRILAGRFAEVFERSMAGGHS